jgi:nickel-type superoxide dismutase maturation protease
VSDLSSLSPRSIPVLVAAAAVAAVVGSSRWRIAVHGVSMAPALQPGDRLLLVPAWRLRAGDVVAVRDPRDRSRLLVKRISAVDRRASLVTVLGDNPGASTDSRTFGPVPGQSVAGRAVFRYAPPARTGRLR